MAGTENILACQSEGQRTSNERLKSQIHNPNDHDVVNSPWLPNKAINRLPPVRQEFDMNRDPYIAKQLRDQDKTETQRRDDQAGRGSTMIQQDQPKPVLKPHNGMSQSIDNQQFNNRWLAEQRNSAMKQHQPEASAHQQMHEPTQQFITPSR